MGSETKVGGYSHLKTQSYSIEKIDRILPSNIQRQTDEIANIHCKTCLQAFSIYTHNLLMIEYEI